ncbi:hypothetical protein chiPu_0011376 [Chiloscyllium punctatum]|uniref:Uncharacterized protein n=1 Tax=Chiloscyllium punctatum TaxID=137246 RepID=A0A401SRB8_CHIPU|nr:hypothetical protein [Chiloscyllium punctatum]
MNLIGLLYLALFTRVGSYIEVAFASLALLFLLCVLIVCTWIGCEKVCEKLSWLRRHRGKTPGTAGFGSSTTVSEEVQTEKTSG